VGRILAVVAATMQAVEVLEEAAAAVEELEEAAVAVEVVLLEVEVVDRQLEDQQM